jgi:hypothetical protein
MGLTIGLISCYQSFALMADIAVALPVFTYGLENVNVQCGKICWHFGRRTLNRYRSLISISLVSVWEVKFVLFNSMLKYAINRLMHAFFHIRTIFHCNNSIGTRSPFCYKRQNMPLKINLICIWHHHLVYCFLFCLKCKSNKA